MPALMKARSQEDEMSEQTTSATQKRVVQEALKRNESILRAQAPWTEQQERLLRAAQDLVNDAGDYDGDVKHQEKVVSRDLFDALQAIVQEISDDAAALVRSSKRDDVETFKQCGSTYGVYRCASSRGHHGAHEAETRDRTLTW